MASVRKRNNTYQIRVCVGKRSDGKPDYRSFTWVPDPSLTARQIETQLSRKVIEYEDFARQQKEAEIAAALAPVVPTFEEFTQ